MYEHKNSVIETSGNHYIYEKKAIFYGEALYLDEISDFSSGNCVLCSVYLTINKPDITTGVFVSVYDNEEFLYPVVKGDYPTAEEKEGNIPIAMLGRSYINDVYVIDEKEYIDIQGEQYLVTGYFGGISREYDEMVLLFGNNMGDMAKEALETDCMLWGIEVLFQSNISDVAPNFSDMENSLKKYGELCEVDIDYVFYTEVSSEKDIAFYLILLYCAVITIMISMFWMHERKKEIVIRKKYGYSREKLIFLLLKELFYISLISVIFALLIIIIINNFAVGYMADIWSNVKLFVITILVYGIFAVSVALIYPLYVILRKMSY